MRFPFLPLCTAFLLFSFDGSKKCPRQGDSTDMRTQQLNLLKNRILSPAKISIDPSITLAALLNSKDDSSLFNVHHAAILEGFLADVKQEQGEPCNCHSADSADWNIKLYLSSGRDITGHGACAVAVISPYSRNLDTSLTFAHLHALIGKKIKVTGWMLFDFTTKNTSYASHPSPAADRRTVWEIHPVTKFETD